MHVVDEVRQIVGGDGVVGHMGTNNLRHDPKSLSLNDTAMTALGLCDGLVLSFRVVERTLRSER